MTGWPKTQKFELDDFPLPPGRKCAGIGIDVISVKRAGVFLKRHSSGAFERLLSPREKKRFKGRCLTPFLFSKLFAAKEAYFKAVGGTWMGIEGFSAIDVRMTGGNHFRAEASGLRRAKSGRAEGVFFRFKELIGAQVVIWN
jgi:phosphopantetheine--protein transferase-like protein